MHIPIKGATNVGCPSIPPNAAVGMEFTFVSDTNKLLKVDPNGSDTIKYATGSVPLAAGDKLSSPGATADSLTLFCATANTWSVKAMKGTWTDDN